jgi:hypothetical protein
MQMRQRKISAAQSFACLPPSGHQVSARYERRQFTQTSCRLSRWVATWVATWETRFSRCDLFVSNRFVVVRLYAGRQLCYQFYLFIGNSLILASMDNATSRADDMQTFSLTWNRFCFRCNGRNKTWMKRRLAFDKFLVRVRPVFLTDSLRTKWGKTSRSISHL